MYDYNLLVNEYGFTCDVKFWNEEEVCMERCPNFDTPQEVVEWIKEHEDD